MSSFAHETPPCPPQRGGFFSVLKFEVIIFKTGTVSFIYKCKLTRRLIEPSPLAGRVWVGLEKQMVIHFNFWKVFYLFSDLSLSYLKSSFAQATPPCPLRQREGLSVAQIIDLCCKII